jgi:predicted metal-dependent hydrolase
MDFNFNFDIVKKKVRNANIKISFDKQIVVTVPLRYSKTEINDLIKLKLNWINKTLQKLDATKEKVSLKPDQLLLFGKTYTKTLNPALKNKVVVNFNSETIDSNYNLNSRKVQAEWYKAVAIEYFPRRVNELALAYKLEYNKITIRGQKTRWGSCTAKKNLSFNWKLMKAPHFVIDYIIVHELAHTKFMNHSKTYWKFVESVMPDYQRSEDWLKKFGGSL